jgi:hypothetical protein
MLNSELVVLWKNEDGSTTVSQRKAVWYMEPLVLKMPKRIAEPVEPKLTAVSCRPPLSQRAFVQSAK